MRIALPVLICFFLAVSPGLLGQTAETSSSVLERGLVTSEEEIDLKIFPVPVLNNRFTVTSDKAYISIRMTNIIGQEVTREKFNYPQNLSEITFANAERGIYLITIEFEDRTKMVKKILVDSGN